MLELGKEEQKAHQKIGEQVGELREVVFVAVGERMKLAVEGFKVKLQKKEIKRVKINSKVRWFATSEQAGNFLEQNVMEKDVILVKGSRGMKMEKIVIKLTRKKTEPSKVN